MDSVIAKKQKTITKIDQQSQGNKDIFQLFFELIFQYVGGGNYLILSTVSKAWQRYYSMVMNNEKLTSVADCMVSLKLFQWLQMPFGKRTSVLAAQVGNL